MPSSYRYSVTIKSHTDPDYHHVVGVGLTKQAAAIREMGCLHVIKPDYFVEVREEELCG